ncbi:acetylornithine aminotransferase, partial [Nowakowskiella sp. JEL0078]
VSHPDSGVHPGTADRINADDKYLLKLYGQPNIYFTHGEGCYLFDQENRKYLDLNAGIAVNALGHNNPDVLNAINHQAKKIIHLSNLYRNENAGPLAKLLVEGVGKTGKFEADGTKVFFCNSGTEANEASFKFAKKWGKHSAKLRGTDPSEKYEIVSFGNAFHGRTIGALSATPNIKYQGPFSPLVPGFLNCPYNDILKATEIISEKTCAVIMEPVQGEGGIHIATNEFLEFIRKRCDEVGALLIFDEIQSGLGRTGKLFSYQHHPWVTPDIATIAKPLANGIPIGAVIVSPHVAEIIKPGDHGTTFGGSPFATHVGKVVLEKISNPEFLESVTEKGHYAKTQLKRLVAKDKRFAEIVTEVRGSGLIIALQIKEGVDPVKFVDLARERGVLVITASCNTIRLVPPLIITKEQIDHVVNIFEDVLETLTS